MQRFKITRSGYDKMKAELEHLMNVERPSISKAIGEAIELGDLSENAEYTSAKEKQVLVENKIALLTDRLSRADIVDLHLLEGTDSIDFGATVTLIDEDTERKVKYQLVSEFESDIEDNKLSIESPLGKALVGKKIDDEIELKIPTGIRTYLIEDIQY